MDLEDAGCRARFLIRDRDGKFPGLFDVILADACWVPKRGIGMLTCQYDCGSGPRAGSIAGL